MSLEEAIGYVQADELIEVTPTAIRLRKAELNSSMRKSNARKAAKSAD
jgi:GTP-binding protein